MHQQDLTLMTKSSDQQQSLSIVLREMLEGSRIARAIQVAAIFGIADLLKDGPKHVAELASSTQTHEDSLYRLLRALASVGVFQEKESHCFAQTPLSALLQSDCPDTMRNTAMLQGSMWHWRTWEGLPETIRTGKSAFDLLFGMDLWKYFHTVDPDAGKIFNRAMATGYAATNIPIAQAYDFSTAKTLVEIGGGQGSPISTI